MIVSVDTAPTFGQFLMLKVAARRTSHNATRVHASVMVLLTRITLHIAGFACLTYAAYMASVIAGFAVGGLSCFVMSTLFAKSSASANTEQPQSLGRMRQ